MKDGKKKLNQSLIKKIEPKRETKFLQTLIW